MVAIKPRDADRFLAEPTGDIRMFLIHGADAGSVTERTRAIVKTAVSRGSGDGIVIRLGSEDLTHDPGRLADEALSVSMFGGDPVIIVRVNDGRHNLMPALQPLIDAPPDAAWIVIEAGELRTSSPLRKAFEGSDNTAAIICYELDNRDLGHMIRMVIADAGKAIDDDAALALTSVLGTDRLATRNELEKLILYAGDDPVITLDHVMTTAGETLALRSDRIIDAALLGYMADMDSDLVRLLNEGQSPSGLATQMLRHLLTMQSMRQRLDDGSVARQVVDSARPPIFFKRRSQVSEALRRWPARYLQRARMIVGDAVLMSRKTPQLEFDLVSDALHRIALMARRLAQN